jgi:hypothetical protein
LGLALHLVLLLLLALLLSLLHRARGRLIRRMLARLHLGVLSLLRFGGAGGKSEHQRDRKQVFCGIHFHDGLPW